MLSIGVRFGCLEIFFFDGFFLFSIVFVILFKFRFICVIVSFDLMVAVSVLLCCCDDDVGLLFMDVVCVSLDCVILLFVVCKRGEFFNFFVNSSYLTLSEFCDFFVSFVKFLDILLFLFLYVFLRWFFGVFDLLDGDVVFIVFFIFFVYVRFVVFVVVFFVRYKLLMCLWLFVKCCMIELNLLIVVFSLVLFGFLFVCV